MPIRTRSKPNRRAVGAGLLRNPHRRRILRLLKHRPGLATVQIARRLHESRRSLSYHLELLENKGRLVRRTQPGRTLWFPASTPAGHMERIVSLFPRRRRQIAWAILRRPGRMQADLTRALRVSRKVFRDHVDALVDQGWVVEARDSNRRRYFPTRRLKEARDLVRRHG